MSALFVLLVGVLAACGGGGGGTGGGSGGDESTAVQDGGALRIDFGEEPKGLDPLTFYTYAEINVISQINETLFKTNADGKVEPHLVESFEKSKDERTWTLNLQPGVTFSDGQPMTSKDVVFSLEGVRKSPIWGSIFASVEKVRANGPSTVTMEASQPVPAMPAILSLFAAGIVPDDFGGVSQKQFAQSPVGTGPFALGTWNRGQSLTLVRNETYWGPDKAHLDEVVITGAPDPESRLSQLRGGQLDVVFNPNWSQIDRIDQEPGLEVGTYALGLTDYLIVNSRTPLFEDPRVRKAIDIGLNREDIVSAAFGDKAPAAGSWFPLSLPYADPDIEAPAQDVEQATRLLADAVAESGEKPEFTLTYLTNEGFYATIGQVAQQNLEAVGFAVELQPMDAAAGMELLENGETDVTILSVYSTIPDPTELATFYVGTEALWSAADTTAVNRLAEEGLSEVDPDKRRAIYYEIQEIIDREDFLVTTNDRPWTYALDEDVDGFSVGPTGTPWLNEVGFAG